MIVWYNIGQQWFILGVVMAQVVALQAQLCMATCAHLPQEQGKPLLQTLAALLKTP